jgi:hypothetical protein
VANRYWVGGTATWQASNAASWSASSGGAGGASVPTASDDAFFDSASGGGTITIGDIGSGVQCLALNFTGFAGTLNSASSSIGPRGSVTFGSGMSFSGGGSVFLQISGTSTITSNNKTLPFGILVGTSVSVTLADAINTTSSLNIQGTFNAANNNVTALRIKATSSASLSMGSGTWTITDIGDGIFEVWDVDSSATITASTSTVKLTDTSSSNKTFNGGGKTYNNIWFVGGGTGEFRLVGSNTFNDFKFTTPPGIIKFTAGTTTTVTTFTVSGTADNLVTIGSITASPHTLSKSGGGVINTDYISVSNSNATPSSTWFADVNSTSAGGNSGWVFASLPATASNCIFFGGGI